MLFICKSESFLAVQGTALNLPKIITKALDLEEEDDARRKLLIVLKEGF